jgi:hypothetical protein
MATNVFPSYVIFNATNRDEYLALSAANKGLYQLVLSLGLIDMEDNGNAKVILWALFGEGSVTRASIYNAIVKVDTDE